MKSTELRTTNIGQSAKLFHPRFAIHGSIAVCCMFASFAKGAVMLVSPASINQVTPTITFSEPSASVTNPSYYFTGVPVYNDLTISFGSIFQGQVPGTTMGFYDNTLTTNQPTSVSLDPTGPTVARQIDFAAMDFRLGGLDGGTYFTTPIAIAFDKPVSSVGFNLGHLDTPTGGGSGGGTGPVVVEVYDEQGNIIAQTNNDFGGFQDLAFADDQAEEVIAGVSVYVEPGEMDWEGFTIDDVFVGGEFQEEQGSEEENGPGEEGGQEGHMPEPATFLIWTILGACTMLRPRSRGYDS